MSELDVFAEKVTKKKGDLRAHLPLTWRCNLRCIHCYPYLSGEPDLTMSEIINKLDRLHRSGCLFISLSGGEPLLRDDFLPIAKYISSKFLALALETNGNLITPSLADEIRLLNFFLVKVTLLGATADTHERITGVKGSFEKTLSAIDILKKRGINVTLRSTVIKENIAEIDKIEALAEEIGISFESSPRQNLRQDNRGRGKCHQVT